MKTNYVSIVTNRSTNDNWGCYELEKGRLINIMIEKDNDSIDCIKSGIRSSKCVWRYCHYKITWPIESTINRGKS